VKQVSENDFKINEQPLTKKISAPGVLVYLSVLWRTFLWCTRCCSMVSYLDELHDHSPLHVTQW